MPACCVTYCVNRTEYGNRLFVLPQGLRNKERRDIWLKNIDRDDLPANIFICEAHFAEDQFENNREDGKRPLKKTAIPTLFDESLRSKHIATTKVVERESNSKKESHSTTYVKEEIKEPSGDAGEQLDAGLRRSKRVRKPIKFEEYFDVGEERESPQDIDDNKQLEESTEDEIENIENNTRRKRRHPKKNELKRGSFLRCRTCLSPSPKEMSHILKEMLLGKTIKDILSLCVPEMSATLRGEEYICNKCYRFLVKLMLFIDSCLESTEKIGTGAVSLECKEEEEDEESAVDDNNKITETEESPTSKRGSKRKQDLSKFTKTEDGGELDETRKPTEPPKKRGRKRKYPIEAEAVDEELYVSRDVQRPTGFKCYGRKDVQKDQAAAANAQDTNQGNAEEDVVSNTFTTVNIVRVCPPAPVETKEIDLVTPDDHSNVILIDHNYVPESTEYLMRCSSCLTDYRTLRGIKSHLTQSHGIQEEYQTVCSLCNMKFIRYKDLLKHRKSHGHPCDLCEQVFDLPDKLDAHVQSHVEKFCCVRCGAKFKKEEQLNKHVPLHAMMSKIRELFAKMEKPELECSQCPLKFVNASKLQQHNNVVHLKIKPFKCEECGKEYTTKATLNTHFRVNHSSNILLPYQCGECGTSFRKKESLERHHEVVHPPSAAFQNPNLKTYSKFNAQEREYQCIFCAFKTKEKQELIDHLSVHADRRKYFECSYCRLKLSCERTKTIHERSHEDPLNQHVCSTCWKRFSTEEDLKEHEEHHNMVSKKFSCSLCSQTFNRQLQLENHILDVHVQTLQTEIDKSKLELIEQNKRAVAMDWSTDEEEEDMLDEEEEEEETETSMLSTEVTPETEMRGKVIKSLIENDTFEATDNEDEEVIELGEEELETVEDADEIYVRNIIKRQKGGQIETENTQKREAKSATQEGKPAVPEEVKSDVENKVKREDNKPKTMKVEIY